MVWWYLSASRIDEDWLAQHLHHKVWQCRFLQDRTTRNTDEGCCRIWSTYHCNIRNKLSATHNSGVQRKLNCHKKSNTKKAIFYSYYIATDCITTLPGKAAEKERHHPDRSRDPSKFITYCKMIKEYYDGIPASDIVNRNAQFLLGIEEAVRTA
eukprot:4596662-Ditylum_brightwellii.AAC.1